MFKRQTPHFLTPSSPGWWVYGQGWVSWARDLARGFLVSPAIVLQDLPVQDCSRFWVGGQRCRLGQWSGSCDSGQLAWGGLGWQNFCPFPGAVAHQCRPVGYNSSAAGEGQALCPALSSSSLTRNTAGARSKADKKGAVRWGEQIWARQLGGRLQEAAWLGDKPFMWSSGKLLQWLPTSILLAWWVVGVGVGIKKSTMYTYK